MLQNRHCFLLFFFITVDLVEHYLYLIFLHRDIFLIPTTELLQHIALHFKSFHLSIEESLLLIQLLLQLFNLVTSHFGCQL
jgi:hypothetical protein